jgi:N-acetylglucosaminyl-diphospho-decaprenol L-rhamnosyltransferase
MARVAALVVAYNSAAEVRGLSASLAASTGTHTIDVFVIDNSGNPDEIAELSAMPGIHGFVASNDNLGYGAGMNALKAGLTEPYDWYLVCNPDIRFEPDTVSELVAAAERHPVAGLFGPKILGSDGVVYPSARAFPSIRTGVGHALFSNVWPSNPWTRRYHRGGGPTVTVDTEVDWLSGACLLVRPEAWDLVGGFDDGFFMYFEDVDLAFRLAREGREAVFVPAAVITHSGAHSTNSQADLMRNVHHRSARRYLDKKYTGWWLAPVRWGLRLALFIRREFFRR